MKFLGKYLKDYKKESIFAPLFKMLEAIFELLVPLVMASIIDVGIANRDRDYVIHMCLLLILFAILGLAFAITAQYFAAKAAIYTASKMRADLFTASWICQRQAMAVWEHRHLQHVSHRISTRYRVVSICSCVFSCALRLSCLVR